MGRQWVIIGWLATGVLCSMLAGCVTNAATGRSQLNALSREDEIAIGDEALPQLTEEYGGAIGDASLNQYVTGVAMSMVAHTEADYRGLPWKFTLLNSGVINAFALPGGKVFLSRALAEKFTSEAQLAGVLGHEIGHVTAEHADRAIGRAMILQGIVVAAGVIAGDSAAAQQAAGLLVDATGTFSLKFSRDQENEADQLGMRYMTRAGYHPKGMLEVMQVLSEASKGKSPPEWQSTHPAPETRIGIIRERLESEGFRGRIAQGDLQTFEARFQNEFLGRMRAVPPPRDQPRSEVDLDQPETWCMHCARRAALVDAAR